MAGTSRLLMPHCIVRPFREHARCRGASLVAKGILDSYKREKALQGGSEVDASEAFRDDRPDAAMPAVPAELQASQDMLTFESVDPDVCPAECVVELESSEDLKGLCKAAGEALVIVDFYKTSCGACKYVAAAFARLCRTSYEGEAPRVIFARHNVFDDEEEEKTDLARRLHIDVVPQFMLFQGNNVVDTFTTRDRKVLETAIMKHISGSAVPSA